MVEPPGPHDPDGLVIAALLAACPSFAQPWQEHVGSSAGQIGSYVDVGAFANHVVDLLEANTTAEFGSVFQAVERLLTDGDPGARYLVTFGLIEDIQNVRRTATTGRSQLASDLGYHRSPQEHGITFISCGARLTWEGTSCDINER